ncbi:MAG: 50S ribosomal protein L9 [Kofleriaceae bacterium]
MPMQIILTQDIPNLGDAGELVSVRPGYGRNYLVPRGMAVSATAANVHKLEHDKRVIAKKVAKERATAEAVAERINLVVLQFDRQVGEEDKLFGSVTSRDITEQLAKAEIEIDHRWVVLDQPIKALGKYEVPIKLGNGVTATCKFFVVATAK